MRATLRSLGAAALAASCLIGPCAAAAADNEAGVPLSPGDAAGAWTVELQGRGFCVVRLSAERSGDVFGMKPDEKCGDRLDGATGWKPTPTGLAFTGADGQTVIDFGRWSNSLFVARGAANANLQLKRGMPGATP